MIKPITINCDFDGTCVTHSFPDMGKEIGAAIVLKKLVEKKNKLILFTMRCDHDFEPESDDPDIISKSGTYLTDAINWFKSHKIPLYGIQSNPTQHRWTSSPKSYAELMIDDSALGCPIIRIPEISKRPFVDWMRACDLLWARELLDTTELNDCKEEIENFFFEEYAIRL